MDIHTTLNNIYKPLHDTALRILHTLRNAGYTVRLVWCNLHETKISGRYETEYYPLPEIEIDGISRATDLGIRPDGQHWLEITLTKTQAVVIDYPALCSRWPIEIYGATDYLTDFYTEKMDVAGIPARIAASDEEEIHILFSLHPYSDESLLELLCRVRTITTAR